MTKEVNGTTNILKMAAKVGGAAGLALLFSNYQVLDLLMQYTYYNPWMRAMWASNPAVMQSVIGISSALATAKLSGLDKDIANSNILKDIKRLAGGFDKKKNHVNTDNSDKIETVKTAEIPEESVNIQAIKSEHVKFKSYTFEPCVFDKIVKLIKGKANYGNIDNFLVIDFNQGMRWVVGKTTSSKYVVLAQLNGQEEIKEFDTQEDIVITLINS